MVYYYYCSFDGSGVGFLPGSVESSGNGIVSLSTGAYPPFILKCFESGEVRSAWGVLPDSDRYFILQKKLKSSRVDAGGGRKRNFYMNISAVCDSYEEFAVMASRNAEKDTLARAVLDSIVLDESDPFRYKVDTGKLETIGAAFSVRSCANGMPYPEPGPQDRRAFVLPTDPEISEQRILEELSCQAGQVSILSGVAKAVEPGTPSLEQTSGSKWELVCGPEKKSPLGWVIPVCLAGAVLALAIFWLTSQSSQPEESIPAESQTEQQAEQPAEQQTTAQPSKKRSPLARLENKAQNLVQSLAGGIKRLVPDGMKAKQAPTKAVWNDKTGLAKEFRI